MVRLSMTKKSRRVVMLSRVDAERLERGEIATPEEALHIHDAPPVKPRVPKSAAAVAAAAASGTVKGSTPVRKLSPHEQDILAEVPPHFGKL